MQTPVCFVNAGVGGLSGGARRTGRRACGGHRPVPDPREERTQHAEHFGRRTDQEFAASCQKKDHVGVSLDGLPALPFPLPRRTDTVRGR